MEGVISRARSLVVRFGPTSAVLLLSQAISAFSLFLLPMLGLNVSDVYSVGVQTGVGPYNGLVLGVIYLLVLGRPNFSRWQLVNASVVGFAALLTAYSAFSALHRVEKHALDPTLIGTIVVTFGCGGAALGLASVSGVRQACLGRPWLLAGVTMVPNIAMGLAAVLTRFLTPHAALAPVFPAVAWASMAVLVAIVFALLPLPALRQDSTRPAVETNRNKALHIFGLLVGMMTSTVLPIGFVTAAGKLNPGAATVLFLTNRIGAAIVGVLVNAVLMVSINWEETDRSAMRHSVRFPALSLGLAIGSTLLHMAGGAIMATYAGIGLAWLSLTCSTPIILREVNVRRMGSVIMLKSVVDLAISFVALLYFQKQPSFTGYFGALMISQCVTSLVCGTALRQKALIFVSCVNLAVATALLCWGW